MHGIDMAENEKDVNNPNLTRQSNPDVNSNFMDPSTKAGVTVQTKVNHGQASTETLPPLRLYDPTHYTKKEKTHLCKNKLIGREWF